MQYVILYLWRLIVSCAFVVFTLVVWNNMHVSWFMVLRQSAHLCLGFEVHVHVAHTIICFSYDVGLYSGVWVIISIIWGTCMLFISEYTSLQHKYLCFWYLAGNLNKNSILFVEFFMCAINADVVYTISVMLVSYLLRSLFMSILSFQSLPLLIWMRGLLWRRHQWMINMFLNLISQVWVEYLEPSE